MESNSAAEVPFAQYDSAGTVEYKEPPAVFQAFPKIPRFSKEMMVITEKIDGTNAQVYIGFDGSIKAGSRNRWITPAADNYGFAAWVEANKDTLVKNLGPGRHFGEWWGLGIQRGYGQTEKRFSLFNVLRWGGVAGISTVPCLYQGPVIMSAIPECLEALRRFGSVAAPGFMKPEGIVVTYPTAKVSYKILLENDDKHKGELAA